MRTTLPVLLGFCLILGACAEAPAQLTATASPVVPVGVPDAAPASFIATCAHSAALCDAPVAAVGREAPQPVFAAATVAVADGAASPVPDAVPDVPQVQQAVYQQPAETAFDDAAALRLLQVVNREVNGAMAPDVRLLVNVADDWAPATHTAVGFIGDCKSFAAEKRRRLLAAGFPADRLFYAVVFRSDLGLHALLMVHLESGDYALDSRQPWVTRWYEAPYT